MKFSRNIIAPVTVAGIALVTGGWFLQRGAQQEQNVYFQANLFNEVLHRVSDQFVDQKDPSTLYKMAIDGMLQELGDPHTVLMTADEHERLNTEIQGEYGGVGMEIGARDGWITVISPLPGTPAERVHIMAGDRIVSIDGKTTQGLAEDEAVKMLRGKVGMPVEIRIARIGVDEPMTFKIVREEIRINSVPVTYMIDNTVGYVELVGFRERSTIELKQAIDGLRARGAKSVIIDLRRNPGGLLDQGITISDMFLPRGVLLAETRGRSETMNQKAYAEDPDEFQGMPIVLLVGPGTASAAEIFAGALQDHDRALVVGRTSYGKGSVQSIIPMANKTFLKMTTARWYTPAGRSIQRPYGIGLSHAEGDTTTIDTIHKPAYKTDSGRTVLGGGGITPDVVIKPDTLTVNERAFYDMAQKQAQAYRTASFNYAVKYVKSHPGLPVNFTVDDATLNGFYDQLVASGVKIPREVFDRARGAISEDLASDIAYSLGGQEKWRERVNLKSPEVVAALQLLHKANSPQSLFSAAAQYQAATKTAANSK